MVFKFSEKKEILFECEDFCIKEASWNETRKLHGIFRETLSFTNPWKESPGKNLTLVVLDNEKRVIGGVEVALAADSTSELRSFAVLPELCGKGIGTKLLGVMHDELRKKGVIRVLVQPVKDISQSEDGSWGILTKAGYDYSPTTKHWFVIAHKDPTQYHEGYKLVKEL